MKKKGISIAVVVVVILLAIVGFSNFKKTGNVFKSEKTYTQVYTHHFDVVLSAEQTGLDTYVNLNFNVISNNAKKYKKLSDMDGDGYIVSAFGVYTYDNQPAYVFDARLVNDGNILIYVTKVSDGSVTSRIIQNMSDFAVQDSVSKI